MEIADEVINKTDIMINWESNLKASCIQFWEVRIIVLIRAILIVIKNKEVNTKDLLSSSFFSEKLFPIKR